MDRDGTGRSRVLAQDSMSVSLCKNDPREYVLERDDLFAVRRNAVCDNFRCNCGHDVSLEPGVVDELLVAADVFGKSIFH
jgi:hypothetical protein